MRQQNTHISTPKKVFSLSQLGKSIEATISKTYSGKYWITAEISKLNYYPQSGHCYPLLVEKKAGATLAEFRAMIFKSRLEIINQKFQQALQKSLEDGMSVMFLAKVIYHPVYGLSLNIIDVEPAFTLGEMARERAATIQRLQDEGIFAKNKSLQLPIVVKQIAVISVETSKGYHDFMQMLQTNPCGKAISVNLFPALLQGDRAVESLSAALQKILRFKTEFDAVAIIRGGGGETGLSCYDNYQIAREVANFPLPVFTGIGHATNQTVTELVAWKNLITPTELAYFFLEKIENFLQRTTQAQKTLVNKVRQHMKAAGSRLNGNNRYFKSIVKGKIVQERANLSRLKKGLTEISSYRIKIKEPHKLQVISNSLQKISNFITLEHQRKLEFYKNSLTLQGKLLLQDRSTQLKHYERSLFRNSLPYLNAQKRGLEPLQQKIAFLTKTTLSTKQQYLYSMEEKLRLLNPQNILNRGYSITLHHGKPLLSSSEVTAGSEIKTILSDGTLSSRIVKPTENE